MMQREKASFVEKPQSSASSGSRVDVDIKTIMSQIQSQKRQEMSSKMNERQVHIILYTLLPMPATFEPGIGSDPRDSPGLFYEH